MRIEGKLGRLKRTRRFVLPAAVLFILLVLHFSAYVLRPTENLSVVGQQNQLANPRYEIKAAIIDQLGLTFPNQTFVEAVTHSLTLKGYAVDYYPGKSVGVELFKDLPSHNYKLILFRVHSGYDFLFTSEKYSTQAYVFEQLSDQVLKVQVDANSDFYFGIPSRFISECMNGEFNNTVIILMGCNDLYYPEMARAFLDKGASACVGWTGPVSASDTDNAITILVWHLVVEQMSVEKAVQQTMQEMEVDPTSEIHLSYYLRENSECHP